MGDQFVDIVMIAVEARRRRQVTPLYIATAELRREAIRVFAEDQFKQRRFKNPRSAETTLHDACTQRLKPDVKTIDDFDHLLDDWLRGKSDRLAQVLYRHVRTAAHRGLVKAFFEAPAVAP